MNANVRLESNSTEIQLNRAARREDKLNRSSSKPTDRIHNFHLESSDKLCEVEELFCKLSSLSSLSLLQFKIFLNAISRGTRHCV